MIGIKKTAVNRITAILAGSLILNSCREAPPAKPPDHFAYEHFRDSLVRVNETIPFDTSNLFDKPNFIPSKDSITDLLTTLDTAFVRMQRQEGLNEPEKDGTTPKHKRIRFIPA